MAAGKQSPVTVGVLVIIIVISLSFIIYRLLPPKYPVPNVDWTCENDGYKFIAPYQVESSPCPKCGKEAVRTFYYYDEVCDQISEAYRSRIDPEAPPPPADELDKPFFYDQHTQYKVPSGDWIKEYPGAETRKCPKCNSTDASKIEYAGPQSERRRIKK